MNTACVLVLVTLIVLIGCQRFQVFFDYNRQYEWPSLCVTGKLQSPIDIQINRAQICPKNMSLKVTENSDGAQIIVHAIQNTKDLQNPFQQQTFVKLTQNKTQTNFKSLEFHWHTPSEHKINGKHFDLQLHIVHKSTGKDGRVAVTALLFHLVSDDTRTIFDKLNLLQGKKTVHDFPFDLDGKLAYHYKGSLTTPPCSEIVDWFVFLDSYQISKFQLQKIIEAKNNGNPNSRRVQKFNDRKLYFLSGSCSQRPNII